MRRALIVGIDNYPSAPLSGCVNDANSVASILEVHADGSPNFSVKLMTDPSTSVTRSNLREAIEHLFAEECDIALFYFSGHGFLKNTGGYIVTSDFQRYDEGVSMDDILQLANSSPVKNKIIILDSCHSGRFGSPSISSPNLTQIAEGVTILTASREHESAIEIDGSGVFTALLKDALQGGAADLRGNISPGSIYAYIDQALGAWDQRPVFKTNVTKFISLRNMVPTIPLNELRMLKDFFDEPTQHYRLDPSYEPDSDAPDTDNIEKFRILQKYNRVNLVVPVDAEHMYYAAMESKSCKLTALGYHYWRLANEGKL